MQTIYALLQEETRLRVELDCIDSDIDINEFQGWATLKPLIDLQSELCGDLEVIRERLFAMAKELL